MSVKSNKNNRFEQGLQSVKNHLWSKNGNIKFTLFIGLLAVINITNIHLGEHRSRQIGSLEKELQELKWLHTTAESEMRHASMQSQVAEKVERLHLEELTTPPIQVLLPDR